MWVLHLPYDRGVLHLAEYANGWGVRCMRFSRARWVQTGATHESMLLLERGEVGGRVLELSWLGEADERRKLCLHCLRRYIRDDEVLSAALEVRAQDFAGVR